MLGAVGGLPKIDESNAMADDDGSSSIKRFLIFTKNINGLSTELKKNWLEFI